MSVEIYMVKTEGNIWIPASASDRESQTPLKIGHAYKVDVKEVRNYRFHKKGMALLRFLFDHWEPSEDANSAMFHGQPVAKDFDQFRKNLTCLAGFYTPVWNMRGEVRVVPESLSFGSMSEERFRQVFKGLLNVGWQKILQQVGYRSPESVEQTLQELMHFE
ncbi:MAG: hypothetical protein CMI13_11805 [Oleibacter sp.]|nr:hypothetical protein [Thalassolituus sp.]